MKLNKEQIAFTVVILIVSFLAYQELGGKKPDYTGSKWKSRRRVTTTVSDNDLVTMKFALVSPDEETWLESGRNIYRAPKDHVPMPPLSLSAPPRSMVVTSKPQSNPGLDPYHRLDSVGPVVPVEGVELSPRTVAQGGEEAADDLSNEEEGEDPAMIPVEGLGGEDEVADELAALEQKLSEVGKAVQEEKKPENSKKAKRRVKSILNLRERLAQDAEAKIAKERAARQKLKDEAERRRRLDKIHWLTGEIWYGTIENDRVAPKGSDSLDKYAIKLRIDEIRQKTTASASELQAMLSDRLLEIEFKRWTKQKWSAKNKVSPVNVASIEFAEGETSGAYTVDQFELDRRLTPTSQIERHMAMVKKLGTIGEFGLAKQHLERILKEGHETRAVYQALALAANRDFDYNVELMAVRDGLAKFPEDAILMASAADLYSRLGLDKLATEMFEKAEALAPRNAVVNARHGRHLFHEREGGSAKLTIAKKLLEKASSGRFEIASEKLLVVLDLGEAKLATGDIPGAKRAFERVNISQPGNVRALIGLAAVSLAKGSIEEARGFLKDALERDPESGSIYYNLALCALHEGKWEEARDQFYDAMDADPFLTAKSNCGLGFLYESIGKIGEAQAAYAAALVADPEDGEVLYWNGRGFLLVGDYEQAFTSLRSALVRLPNQFDILAALSDASFHLLKFDDALRYIDAAMALRPKSPGLLIRKAQTLVRLRRFIDAKKCLDASKQQEASDEVEMSLAYYYYLDGNHEEALKRFRSVERTLDRRDESPLASYVRRYAKEIADNLSKRVWQDHFNRVSTGRDLLRGWRSYAPLSGISVNLLNNHVSFSGTQKASDVPSCIFQRRSGREFVSFEAGITVMPDSESICGVGLFTFRKNTGDQNSFVDVDSGGIAYDGLIVAKNREGRLAYREVTRYQLGRWKKIDLPWPPAVDGKAQQIVLGIASEDGKKGTFAILVNGNPVVTGLEIRGLRRTTKDLQLWAFTQAEIDRRIDMKVDDVRIVTKDRKRR